jgi:hypothetical protein
MKSENNPAVVQIRLFFIAALMAVMGLAFVSPYFDKTPLTGDVPQVLVSEVQESFDDFDPVVPDPILYAALAQLMLVFTSLLTVTWYFYRDTAPRFNFLHHIRPRSPPAL